MGPEKWQRIPFSTTHHPGSTVPFVTTHTLGPPGAGLPRRSIVSSLAWDPDNYSEYIGTHVDLCPVYFTKTSNSCSYLFHRTRVVDGFVFLFWLATRYKPCSTRRETAAECRGCFTTSQGSRSAPAPASSRACSSPVRSREQPLTDSYLPLQKQAVLRHRKPHETLRKHFARRTLGKERSKHRCLL